MSDKSYRYFIRNAAFNIESEKWDSLSQVITSNACPCEIDTKSLFKMTITHLADALGKRPLDFRSNRVEQFNCLNPCSHNH
jgi:hypothetical protein